MPIKGISDIIRIPRGGKIRLGEKREKNGKEYPAKLDYFLFDPECKELLSELTREFGEKPRDLLVCFAAEDKEVVFPQYYKCYGATGLLCKGDGETANRVANNGAMVEVECPGPDTCPFSLDKGHGKPGCKRLASLQFFLVKKEEETGAEAYHILQTHVWQIDTTSFHSMVNINTGLSLLQWLTGRISFVPVTLHLKPQQIQPEGKKQIAYVLQLIIPDKPILLKPRLELRCDNLALPAPSEDIPDDLYPASQIGYEEPVVDADGVVAELPELGEETAAALVEDHGEAWEEPEPEPAPPPKKPTLAPKPEPPENTDFADLPEVKQLMEARPAIARAILGQAQGENWTAAQLLAVVKTKLKKG